MDYNKNRFNNDDEKSSLEIADFEPFFLSYFGINIPLNLKPIFNIPTIPKKEKDQFLNRIESIDDIKDFFKMEHVEREYLKLMSLRTLPESRNSNIKYLKVSSDFGKYKEMTTQELKDKKQELRKMVKVSWLSNGIGEKYITIGVPNIEELPNGIFQMGLQSSSTKDYFKYVSTTENRKVGIRFKLWFQYESNNEKRLEEIARFFKEFERFEEQIKNYAKLMIFYFDELGTKKMKLELKDASIVEWQKSSMHPNLNFDFDELYKKIKIDSNL